MNNQKTPYTTPKLVVRGTVTAVTKQATFGSQNENLAPSLVWGDSPRV